MRRRFLVSSSAQSYPNAPLPNQVGARATFLPFTDAGNDWQGRPVPMKMNDGNWMVVWKEGADHSDYAGAAAHYNIAFSNDEGATWTDNNEYFGGGAVTGFPLVPPTGSTGFVDSNLIKCPNGDLVIIAQNRGSNPGVWNNVNFSQHQYRSTDNGQTWTYEFDFCEEIGFTTTADKAKIQGNYENMVVGSTVYIILCQIRTNLDDTRISLYKSTDNCATYSLVSHPVEYDEASPDCTESSIADLGNGIFFCVFRTQNLAQAVWKRSEDFGLTWGALTEFSEILGNVGVHQPRVVRFANFFLLCGRETKPNLADPTVIYHLRSTFWTTTDLFVSSRKQYLDPYYAGNGTGSNASFPDAPDGGYAKFLVKNNGTFVFFGYWGENDNSFIYKYEASNTGSPSQEDTSNLAFDPTTITTSGFRLQFNRDNLFAITPAVSGGLVIIGRAHNTLISGTGSGYWLGEGTRGEFFVINNKGWCQFGGSSRYRSVTAIANTIFNASFSIGFWTLPDDGQPAATQMIIQDVSVAPSDATLDRVQVFLTTDGRIRATYMINNVGVVAETANVIFANGAASTPVHVAATWTSGGLIRIYIDGVLQGYNGANTGDISGLTMASYNNASLQTTIGMRQTGASSYDLGYVGKLREFICQPVVWSAGDITNIMLN